MLDTSFVVAPIRGHTFFEQTVFERQVGNAFLQGTGFAAQILHLAGGCGTIIGDGGRRLSGGEQQRIALARALLRDPQLLILDEATSALDGDSEASVVEAIRALQGRLTILIIAHRGALVSLADRVVEVADGRIIGETKTK